MLPQPADAGRLERDDHHHIPPPSRTVSEPNSQDTPADGSLSHDQATKRNDPSTSSLPNASAPQRRLVVPDPLTFRFLEDDPCVTIVERRHILTGYELYLVEQWACSRQTPIITVTTYTGDEKHSLVVGVVSIPQDSAFWSARLRLYQKTANQYNARPKDTKLGDLMITNLSSFPSALTVIAVPDGDIRKHRELFIVNENLKRLGCSGRSGLTLTEPTEATQAKFNQLYKTSDRIPIVQTVLELVKLCQAALYMFEKLDYQYIDGLLCDVTERAISNWWTEVGAEHYNFEPTDGILGPSTVSALLGMLMGARNRLHWFGAPVSKDVFEIEATKRGVAYFQKQQNLEKTRRLDQRTLFRLHTATAKGAAGDGWGVQKAVKSTVTEIGGKRGEIVMDMVGGRDKGGLADIETLDIDRFISLAYGDRPRWLWHGKARKALPDVFAGDQDPAVVPVGKSEAGGSGLPSRRTNPLSLIDELEARRKEESSAGPLSTLSHASTTNLGDISGERDASRRGVLKSVTDKMSDARSGLGRIKDAVGGSRRGHTSRYSISAKKDGPDFVNEGVTSANGDGTVGMAPSPAIVTRAFTWNNKPEEYLAALKRGEDILPGQDGESRLPASPVNDVKPDERSEEDALGATLRPEKSLRTIGSDIRKDVGTKTSSARRFADNEEALRGPLQVKEQEADSKAIVVARRRSCGVDDISVGRQPNEARWPRRVSFSDAEEAVLVWDEVIDINDTASYLACIDAHFGATSHLDHLIEETKQHIGPWAEEKVKAVELLDERFERDTEELQKLHSQLHEACQRVRYSSDELLGEQRESLTVSVKEIESLVARLEYEINGLVQKVHDVEDSVQNFERQVDRVESRAAELKVALETEGWLHWLVRSLTGIGTGPNITREA